MEEKRNGKKKELKYGRESCKFTVMNVTVIYVPGVYQ